MDGQIITIDAEKLSGNVVKAQARGNIIRILYKLETPQKCSEFHKGKKRTVICKHGIEEVHTSRPYSDTKSVWGYSKCADHNWLSNKEFKAIMADNSLFDSRCVDY